MEYERKIEWSMKRKLTCPVYNMDTASTWLIYGGKHCYCMFDGGEEHGRALREFSRHGINI